MAKSLLLLTLVVAQLLAGSGGAVYLCPDCGSLLSVPEETPQPACSCCHAAPASSAVDAAGWTKSDQHSPIPLLAPQSPSRLRDGEFVVRCEQPSAAPLHLSAVVSDGTDFSRPRACLAFAAGASHLAARATVCLRC